VKEGQTHEVAVELERWVHMAKDGWYSGELHIHANYGYGSWFNTPQTMRQQCVGEDLNVCNFMVANSDADYPQVYNQKPGLGFPIARLGAVVSLACGAVVSLGFCRYAGKGQGEVSLLRRLWDVLRPGDVLLADRLSANWATIFLLPTTTSSAGPSRLRSVRWSARPTSRCPSPSRSERRGSGSRSRDSGPGRSWW